jgi:hypothetical protein
MLMKYKFVLFFSFLLAFANIFVIFSYILSKYYCYDSGNENINEYKTVERSKQEKIMLNFGIMDIYRIDISCDYITKDLYQPISKVYQNYEKKCSLSSLDQNVDKMIENSLMTLNQTETRFSNFYKLNINISIDFDPFQINQENISSENNITQDLHTGGTFLPKLNDNKDCELNDLDDIVFIVPYSYQRYHNLKYFLLNIHSYLKAVKYKFKYRILVVEQQMKGDNYFNKGRLINTAFKYSMENFKNIDCLIIHDVDIIPSYDHVLLKESGDYRCNIMPKHLSLRVFHLSNKKTVEYNQFLTGGVLSLRYFIFLIYFHSPAFLCFYTTNACLVH